MIFVELEVGTKQTTGVNEKMCVRVLIITVGAIAIEYELYCGFAGVLHSIREQAWE